MLSAKMKIGIAIGLTMVIEVAACSAEEKKQQRGGSAEIPIVNVSSNPSGQDQASADGTSTGTDGGAGSSTGTPPVVEPQIYKAVLGDTIVFVDKSKSWTDREVTEIPYWSSDAKSEGRVTKVYDSEKSEKFRRNTKLVFDNKANRPGNSNDEGSNTDYGLAAASGTECGESKCQESDAGTKDFGVFAGAKGKKQVCDVVSCKTPVGNQGGTNKDVSRIETTTYTHPKTLNPDFVVKVLSKTCSTTVPGETEVATLDVCAVVAGRRTNFSKTDFEIVEQRSGQGGAPVSTSVPRGSFKYTGSDNGAKRTTFSPASCQQVGTNKLTVTINSSICDSLRSGAETLKLAEFIVTKGEIAIPTGKATLVALQKPVSDPPDISICARSPYIYTSTTYASTATSGCKITLTPKQSENMIEGTGKCDGGPLVRGQTGSVNVESFSFACDAPDSFDFDVLK